MIRKENKFVFETSYPTVCNFGSPDLYLCYFCAHSESFMTDQGASMERVPDVNDEKMETVAEVMRKRFVLRGGTTVNLVLLYLTPCTINIDIKWGNVRHMGNYIAINVQRQLEEKSITYKPTGTHISILRVLPGVSGDSVQSEVTKIADEIGGKTYELTLTSWGRHSVHLSGELVQEVRRAAEGMDTEKVCLLETMHVELLPRLQEQQVHVEANEEELARIRGPR